MKKERTMFSLFKKDPLQKLEKEYAQILEKAMQAQRNGKMDVFAKLSSDAEKIGLKIDDLKKEKDT